MKVLLFKPGTHDGSEHEMPNIGMGVVAAKSKQIGGEITVLDGHFANILAIPIPSIKEYDIVYLSLVSQEWNLLITQRFIDEAKRCGKKVIVGGPHAGCYTDELRKDNRIDFVEPWEIDDLDITPDYSDFIGIENAVTYGIALSRGCTNSCNFCAASKLHGKWRKRDVEQAWKELDSVGQYPKVKLIHVVDDSFSADLDHAKHFLREYKRRGYPWKLNIMNVRADQIDIELLELIKSVGCDILAIGVESGDPFVFRKIGKGESLSDIEDAIEMMHNVGITPWLNMIVGLPYETKESATRSIQWAMDVPNPKIVHWFQYAPFKGTRAYNYFVKKGAIKDPYIPPAYGRRYDELPWKSDFGTEEFTALDRELFQLEGYLRCKSPILINNVSHVMNLCIKHGMKELFDEWKAKAPIEEYAKKSLPYKKQKGQV